jgi:hypothetical protein
MGVVMGTEAVKSTVGWRRRKDYAPDIWQPLPPRPARFFHGFSDRCLERTLAVTLTQMEVCVSPKDIVPLLERLKVEYVVMGLYGISGWLKEPRATQDVDVLIAKRHHKKAVHAVLNAFPGLTTRDTPVVLRFLEDDEPVLDFMKPHHPLFVEALKSTTTAKMGEMKLRVPTLEMALTLKFFSMTSRGRRHEDKYQDAHDFINMVKHNRAIDEKRLRTLGDLAYAGGGDDLTKMVADARAGRKLEI